MVGDDIVITIVKIDRNQVRIGIEAPGHIPVYREEILPVSTGMLTKKRPRPSRSASEPWMTDIASTPDRPLLDNGLPAG